MKSLIKWIVLTAVLCPIMSIATSCAEEADCSMTARAMLNCRLYTIDPVSGIAIKDTLDSLSITAFETDSVIINNQKEVKDLSLPLRFTKDFTVLVFDYGLTVNDTLTIRQTNTPYFLSMDCGYQMKQSITDITYSRHILDSVYILNPEAGIYGAENVKLFY